jgi:hypothetical protein
MAKGYDGTRSSAPRPGRAAERRCSRRRDVGTAPFEAVRTASAPSRSRARRPCAVLAGVAVCQRGERAEEQPEDDRKPEDPHEEGTDDEGRQHAKERLAVALGWALDRLAEAITQLDRRLAPAGLRVHANSVGVTIRPRDERAGSATRRLARLRDADEAVKNNARLIHTALNGGLSKTEARVADRPVIASLHHQGILATADSGEGARLRISDEYRYAFDVD